MPPAAKKKKLRRTTISAISGVSGPFTDAFTDATIRCKQTQMYASAYSAMTLDSSKQANRRIGTTKWYRLNKDALVAIIVLNHFAEKIQRFFKHVVGDDENHTILCPISLVPIWLIPYRSRFKHSNIWFNKEVLAQHMYKTSDFINPVTRVELHEEDLLNIDPDLLIRFRHRKEIRASMAEDMAMVQSVENELEEVFQDMVEAAQLIPSRMEFRSVFDNLAEDFNECYIDLMGLDRDRSVLALKALADIIDGDPTRPVHMSKKRERILRLFLKSQK